MSNKPEDDIELSLEEYEELMEELEEFDEKAFMLLAGSHRYEIIPNITEDGKVLTSKELKMLTDECKKRGFAILYRIDKEDGETLLIGPGARTILASPLMAAGH